MTPKEKIKRLIELLEYIELANKVLIELHDLPILERTNCEIAEVFREIGHTEHP